MNQPRCQDCNALLDADNGLCPVCCDDETFLGPIPLPVTSRNRFGTRNRP